MQRCGERAVTVGLGFSEIINGSLCHVVELVGTSIQLIDGLKQRSFRMLSLPGSVVQLVNGSVHELNVIVSLDRPCCRRG
jgi:hypothetical protein